MKEKKRFIRKLQLALFKDLNLDGVEIHYMDEKYFLGIREAAKFHPSSYRIFINNSWLKRATYTDIILVIAHEMRHAYQKANIDYPEYFFGRESQETIKLWEQNFNNYHTPDLVNLSTYCIQLIEEDADGYAKNFINIELK